MADACKILGQSNPTAATPTDIYTVPGGGVLYAVLSCVTVCNRSTTPTSFRISSRVAGAGADNKQYSFYDCPIGANQTLEVMKGVALATTDVLTVYATLATLSFNVFGVEVT